MKTKTKLTTIIFVASISASFLLNSCSLIGFGIGASVDKKKPKTNTIYKYQIDTLEIGSNVEIILQDGKIKYGKYSGIVNVYDQNFHREYDSLKNSLASQVNLPSVNDTLLISLSSEKNVSNLGIFKGFESGKLWYKYFYSEDFSKVDLSLIDNFTVNYEYQVDSLQVNNIILKQKFPNFIHLKINTQGSTNENIPLINISKILVINKRNVKYIGLGVGLAIDAIIAVAAIKSAQNMSFEMSF